MEEVLVFTPRSGSLTDKQFALHNATRCTKRKNFKAVEVKDVPESFSGFIFVAEGFIWTEKMMESIRRENWDTNILCQFKDALVSIDDKGRPALLSARIL